MYMYIYIPKEIVTLVINNYPPVIKHGGQLKNNLCYEHQRKTIELNGALSSPGIWLVGYIYIIATSNVAIGNPPFSSMNVPVNLTEPPYAFRVFSCQPRLMTPALYIYSNHFPIRSQMLSKYKTVSPPEILVVVG